MPDYHSTPLRIQASSTGGADVDVSATLMVDGVTDQDGDATLVDVHRSEKRASLRAPSAGKTKLRLLFIVVPLVGNGEFEVTVTLTHPDINGGSPLERIKTGDVSDLTVFRSTFNLP